MKLNALGSLSADQQPLAEDVSARMRTIFDNCPQLSGFTVQDVSALPESLRPQGVDEALVVTDMAIHPLVSREQCQTIYESLSLALLELICDRPGAKDYLPGRTFARSVH
jgi:hypothetical protein